MAAILVFEVDQVGQVGDLNFRVHMRPVVEVFADGVFLVVVVQQREREIGGSVQQPSQRRWDEINTSCQVLRIFLGLLKRQRRFGRGAGMLE